ncbi:cyclic nucleotide-binding-like protein [Fimicolochytrium jonesii]|uniref:cyclic nucleotide-binding-like protein n=1 Tax=Fimicolochytrium jonesii TaxID=1396493 RepID=UPI0022FDE3A9|nr:cyclic nucleotide-binding-like protein [Fimicolochytrium jonesii]KAI8822469.1 cyclic nucleotide-binding-like protein [Fimicolochytrium jonesii]
MSPISSPPPEYVTKPNIVAPTHDYSHGPLFLIRSTTDGGESVASTRLTSIDEALRGFLDDHVLFKNLDETFINTVAASMQTRVYGDSAYIIRQGEVGRALFFILKGEVEIVSEDGETVINVMKEQSFFGEVGVLFSVPRTASCRARGRCILATLTKDALQAAVVDHPEAADRIRTIAEERFSSYLKQKERKVLVEFGQELALGMTQSDLKKIPLFRECSVGFLHLLTFKLSPIQFRQNDNIIKKGDAASEMYFIVHGTAAVFNEADGTIFAEFHPGSFFGEVGIFFDVKRTASVRCLTNTAAVFKLTKVDLDGLLKQFPEVNALIQKEAQARLQYDEERRKLAKQHEHTEIEVVRDKIRSVSLFRNADLGFLHQLALQIKMVVCQAGQVIIRKGDQGSSMFFVLEGTAEVVSEDGKQVFAEFHTNGYFGEVALVLDVERTATVRSRGRTTLGELHKNTLDGVLEQYPEFKANLQASAQQSYEQFRKRQQNVEKMGAAKEAFEIEASASRLKQVPMFQNCDDAFLRAMALATFPRQALDGDIVVHQGETSSEMFFVVRGQVQIVSEDGGTVYDTVPSGGFFGEIGLLKNIPRTASVRIASPSCDLMVLTSAALDSVCKQYPESYQTIVVEANRRMEKIEQRQSSRDDLSVRATEGPATVAADGAETERLKSLWDDAAASVKKSVEAQKARDQMHSLAGKAEPEIKTPNRPSSFGRIFYTRQQKAEVPETKGTSSKIASPELVTPGQSSENLTEVQKGAVPKRSSLVSSFLKSLRPGILKRSGSSKNHASTSSLGSEPDITTPVPVSRRQSTYAAPRPSAKPTLQELDAKIQRIILSYLDPITRLSMRCLCNER